MASQIDVLAIGEILIDFTPAGLSPAGEALYERNPGGAPANVAVAVSRLGGSAAFVGKVGNDSFGRYLGQTLSAAGVNTTGLRVSPDHHTTLAFVSLSDTGERDFSFCRNPGADCLLSPDELDRSLIRACRIIHAGSLSFTHEPLRESTLLAVREAKAAGALVSCDPNWRASLWSDKRAGLAAMKTLVSLADIVKVSDVELALLSDMDESAAVDMPGDVLAGLARRLAGNGPSLVLVTMGAAGSLVVYGNRVASVPAFPAPVVDTTGAGDSFAGAFLYRITRRAAPLRDLNFNDLVEDVRFANAAASCCVQKRGAIPAMPNRADVEAVLEQ